MYLGRKELISPNFVIILSMNKYKIHTKYAAAFESFLLNIKAHFSDNTNTIHKARNEIKVIDHNGMNTVVKSFKIPNLFNRIVYSFFRDSKAKKSYENSLKIINFVPQPIGYIEFYNSSLLKNSYFVSQKFDYDFTIREPLLDKSFDERDKIFQAFARFTLELHNENIFHDDYSPGNILIQKDVNGYIFKLVDINRMKFYDLSQMERAKNFSKLWASDDELTVMATEYMKHYECTSDFIDQVLYFSNKNKKIKNFKKRLKGQAVND